MAGAVVEQTWRDTAPDEIEPALAALWRDAGARTPLARAVMSNLVVVRTCEPNEPLDAFTGPRANAIDEVAARHPSRVIVIAHERGCPLQRAPLAARVGVTTYGPAQARYAVEHVSVRASCDESSLPSIVRRLVRGDLPTSLWCPDDLSQHPPLRPIVAEARQLIYDSRAWSDVRGGVRAVQDAVRDFEVDVADLNWRRLSPIFEVLRDAPPPRGVRIAHAPGESAIAWLLAGWLTASAGDARPRVEEDPALTRPLAIGDVADEPMVDAIVAELRSLSSDAALRDALGAIERLTSAASS